jgi:hypothetical protein
MDSFKPGVVPGCVRWRPVEGYLCLPKQLQPTQVPIRTDDLAATA